MSVRSWQSLSASVDARHTQCGKGNPVLCQSPGRGAGLNGGGDRETSIAPVSLLQAQHKMGVWGCLLRSGSCAREKTSGILRREESRGWRGCSPQRPRGTGWWAGGRGSWRSLSRQGQDIALSAATSQGALCQGSSCLGHP